MKKLRLAQVGYGLWGPNLTKAFSQISDCQIDLIVDSNPNRHQEIAKENSLCKVTTNWREALLPQYDAVIISTPAESHYQIAKEALLAKKHIFVEKPLTTQYHQSIELKQIAEEMDRKVMVGHVFLYHEALQYMKKNLSTIGQLLYLSSARLNFGKVRDDVNAWWNFAPHDISMMLYLKNGELPSSISVQGGNFFHPHQEDFAHAVLRWNDGTIGTIDVNWFYPEKIRKFTVVGTDQTFVFDDSQKEHKIKIHPKSIQKLNQQYHYSSKEEIKPLLQITEPLINEARCFIEYINNQASCPTDAKHACDVVNLLEAGDKSLKNKGETIEICDSLAQSSFR